jgi:ferredoxin
MTYVITAPCVGTKDGSCVEVCPVDCIHPTREESGYSSNDMLYIDPDECIDCDACVAACPVAAPCPDGELPPEWVHFRELNRQYYADRQAQADLP